MITRFDTIHERDGQTNGWTDRSTPNDGIGRTYAYRSAAKINVLVIQKVNLYNAFIVGS